MQQLAGIGSQHVYICIFMVGNTSCNDIHARRGRRIISSRII